MPQARKVYQNLQEGGYQEEEEKAYCQCADEPPSNFQTLENAGMIFCSLVL
jgi:hypothetical protein